MLKTTQRAALASELSLRRPEAAELPGLERWLDDGLRRGEAGRLAAEYPLSMGRLGSRRHQCAYTHGRPVAHAMSHTLWVRAHGKRLCAGMVGNVFTDPDFRRQGLAASCIEAAVGDLREDGAAVALLWSDRRDLYARSGFLPAGRERSWDLTHLRECGAAGLDCLPARAEDLPGLEALYAAKPVRVDRAHGALARLLAAPRTQAVVARGDAGVSGYAIAGRGDDFPGVIHEWAGAPGAVGACIARLRDAYDAHTLLSAPEPEGLEAHLAAAGATPREGSFALVRILDAERLWRSIAPRQSALRFAGDARGVVLEDRVGRHDLSHERALELFFGAGPVALTELPRPIRRALARVLPWPLYVWGLDSI